MPDKRDSHGGDCVFSGQFGQVKFARASDGSLMAKGDWDARDDKWRKAFMARFINITSDRRLQLFSHEHFKKVDGDLFEFKHNGHKSRIFAFRDERIWYLVDVFVEKKEDDLPPGVVKRAISHMQEAKAVLAQQRRNQS